MRLVAALEAFKGVVVLLAASGVLALVHRDVHALAAALIRHSHLNPAAEYPRIFIDAASQLDDGRLWRLALGAAAYAAVRLVEAYGLYRERSWAEVLAALSGAVYVPFELKELVARPSLLVLALLALNALVVGLMVRSLLRRRAGAPRSAA